MNRHTNKADRTRRLASLALGSLAVLALAASPALAHTRISNADTVRHTLLASELVGADDTEAADLESLLDTEDGDNQVDANQVDNGDANNDQNDQVDQSSTDQVDVNDSNDNQDESSNDANDGSVSNDSSGGNDGGDGGGD